MKKIILLIVGFMLAIGMMMGCTAKESNNSSNSSSSDSDSNSNSIIV